MRPMFLYQNWLRATLDHYLTALRPPRLRGRAIVMSPRQYGAALMQAYLGHFSLGWIAAVTGIPLEVLKRWRQETEFLLLMDWSKSVFAENFRQSLVLNNYSIAQYQQMAAEFSWLENSLRVAARIKLYAPFRTLGESLLSRQQNNLELENYDLNLFSRLLLFFLALEYYWPSPAGKRLEENFLPLAQEVVWPRLGLPSDLERQLKPGLAKYSLPQLRQLLEGHLREVLGSLP